jgi:hypothetical protein
MNFPRYVFATGVCALILLTGCDKTKEVLGLKREQPDEFTVLSRPPLSAPPSIALAPPKPGARGLNEASSTKDAQDQLGLKASQSGSVSGAEKSLLSKAKANEEGTSSLSDMDTDDKNEDDVPYLFGNESASKKDVIDPVAEKKKHEGVATSGPTS